MEDCYVTYTNVRSFSVHLEELALEIKRNSRLIDDLVASFFSSGDRHNLVRVQSASGQMSATIESLCERLSFFRDEVDLYCFEDVPEQKIRVCPEGSVSSYLESPQCSPVNPDDIWDLGVPRPWLTEMYDNIVPDGYDTPLPDVALVRTASPFLGGVLCTPESDDCEWEDLPEDQWIYFCGGKQKKGTQEEGRIHDQNRWDCFECLDYEINEASKEK